MKPAISHLLDFAVTYPLSKMGRRVLSAHMSKCITKANGHVRTAKMPSGHVQNEHVRKNNDCELSNKVPRCFDECLIDYKVITHTRHATHSAQRQAKRMLGNVKVSKNFFSYPQDKKMLKNVDIARATTLAPATHGFTVSKVTP